MQQRFTFLTLLLLCFSFLSTRAQNWSLTGNADASASSKLGTTNAVPLRLFTNNVPRAFISTNGNFGIGTTNPQQRFHVEAPSLLNLFVNTNPLSSISGSGQIGYTKHTPTASGQRLGYFLFGSRGGAEEYYHGAGMVGYAQGAWSSTSWPAYIAFETTPEGSATRAERMRIDKDGKVGIGTNNSTQRLDVGGTGVFSGQVGIGTTAPIYTLDAQSSSSSVFGRFKSTGTGYAGIIIDKASASSNGYVIHRTAGAERWVEGTMGNDNFIVRNWSAGVNALSIDHANHNVGIGGGNLVFNNGNQSIQFANPGTTSNPMMYMFTSGTQNATRMVIGHSPGFPTWGLRYHDSTDRFDFVGSNAPKVSINLASGRVGIGTINPSYPLSVNGTIQAKEVRVETGWADYVFEKEYKLKPLSEVEKYITQHKHLPGIAPAREIQENGLAVGEMQTKMMEKIEELTLYIIELQKQIDQLKKNNSAEKASN